MYLKYTPANTLGGALHVAAFVVGLAIIGGGMAGAQAAVPAVPAGVPAARPADGAPSPSIARFGLLGADSDAADDCEPEWSGEAGQAARQPVLLSMLDTNSKAWAAGGRPAATGKGKKAAAAPNVESFPVSLPATGGAASADTWEIIVSDKTLNGALARWASKAGWQLLWELPVDYAVQAKTTVHGSFEDAVGTVTTSMEGAEIPMKATFYEGNKVLRIMAKGAE